LAFCRYIRTLYPPELRIAIVLDNFISHRSTLKDTRVGDWAEANNVELASGYTLLLLPLWPAVGTAERPALSVDHRQHACLPSRMDLGIAGRRGIVCASSQGLGRACAEALAREGVDVVINGRDQEKLEKAAAEIQALPGLDREVVPVVADITTEEGRLSLLAACSEPDILVTNNRGPTPGPLPDMSPELFEEALTLHYRAPMALLAAVLPGMKTRGWGSDREYHFGNGDDAS
jgi:hypothetical protein